MVYNGEQFKCTKNSVSHEALKTILCSVSETWVDCQAKYILPLAHVKPWENYHPCYHFLLAATHFVAATGAGGLEVRNSRWLCEEAEPVVKNYRAMDQPDLESSMPVLSSL